MSRNGNTGSSLGICNCWSVSVVSIASVNSGSFTIAMGAAFYLLLSDAFCRRRAYCAQPKLLGSFLLDSNYNLVPAAIFDLRQMNVKHAVLHVGRHIAHAERPAQRNDAAELAVAPL